MSTPLLIGKYFFRFLTTRSGSPVGGAFGVRVDVIGHLPAERRVRTLGAWTAPSGPGGSRGAPVVRRRSRLARRTRSAARSGSPWAGRSGRGGDREST